MTDTNLLLGGPKVQETLTGVGQNDQQWKTGTFFGRSTKCPIDTRVTAQQGGKNGDSMLTALSEAPPTQKPRKISENRPDRPHQKMQKVQNHQQ
jgi:hypothetical protein